MHAPLRHAASNTSTVVDHWLIGLARMPRTSRSSRAAGLGRESAPDSDGAIRV